MRHNAVRSNSSKVARTALSTEGENRWRWCTRVALKEALRRHRASCELIKLSLLTALERSAQGSAHASIVKIWTRNNGAHSVQRIRALLPKGKNSQAGYCFALNILKSACSRSPDPGSPYIARPVGDGRSATGQTFLRATLFFLRMRVKYNVSLSDRPMDARHSHLLFPRLYVTSVAH